MFGKSIFPITNYIARIGMQVGRIGMQVERIGMQVERMFWRSQNGLSSILHCSNSKFSTFIDKLSAKPLPHILVLSRRKIGLLTYAHRLYINNSSFSFYQYM